MKGLQLAPGMPGDLKLASNLITGRENSRQMVYRFAALTGEQVRAQTKRNDAPFWIVIKFHQLLRTSDIQIGVTFMIYHHISI